MAAGRRTKLTPDLQKSLADVFASGAKIKDACAYVGITAATFHNWMARGSEAKSGLYFEFFDIITRARANGRLQALKTINIAMRDESDPHAAARSAQWFLERSDPQEWGKRTYQQIDHRITAHEEKLLKLIEAMEAAGHQPGDMFERMIQRYASTSADA